MITSKTTDTSPSAMRRENRRPTRFNDLTRAHNLVILVGALAMFMGYTALPFYCPLTILALPPCMFWLALTSSSGAQAFKRGWYLGLWGYSASLYWLTVPMTTVGQMPLLMAIPCVMLLGSFLGLYTGLAVFCFRGLLLFFNGTPPNPKTFPLLLVNRFRRTAPHPPSAGTGGIEQKSSLAAPPRSTGEKQHVPSIVRLSGRQVLPSSPFKALALFLAAGLCYGGVELASAHILTGFPWLSLPVALAETPFLIQPVSIFGAYGYSAALTFITLCPFMWFLRRDSSRDLSLTSLSPHAASRSSSNPTLRYVLSPVLVVGLLLGGAGVYSYLNLNQPLSTKAIQVGIVQGNVDQNQKWLPPMQTATLQKYVSLSRKALSESQSPLNLLLWPETAMPFIYQGDEPYRSQVNTFARQNNVSIGFGTLGNIYTPGLEVRQFNRLQLVSPEGLPNGHYDKEHLVPFGEYNPIPFPIPFVDKILQGVNFSSGRKQSLLALPQNTHIDALFGTCLTEDSAPQSTSPEGWPHGEPLPEHADFLHTAPQSANLEALKKPDGLALIPDKKPPLALLGSLICYEVIFPQLAQERVAQGAHILVTISNDAWFGKTAAPQQHLNHAVLRAVEQRRSIIRSTNSGYSALILPNGTIRHKSALYKEDAYSFSAPLSKRTTIYHIFHQVIDGLLLLGLCIAVGLGVQFRRGGS